ncbi:MAG: alpha/beta fold hydrolase [Anaerolineales bacterium]
MSQSDEQGATSRRGGVWRRSLRWAIGLLAVFFTLAAVASSYNWVRTANAMRRLPPPGEMIDIGGRRLHLYCLGKGAPTVILEGGLLDSWLAWSLVQPELAKSTRVCAYDRAGYGYSDSGPFPRTSEPIVSDLNALLQVAQVPSPYVLVAWSFGGFNVRLFAAQHPNDVGGLVLVDTAHEDLLDDPSPAVQKYWNGSKRRSLRRLVEATVGLNRLTGSNLAFPEVLPEDARPYAVAAGFSWQWARTDFSERRWLAAASSDQVRQSRQILNVPVVVITRGKPDLIAGSFGLTAAEAEEVERKWQERQRDLLNLSATSRLIIAEQSDHSIVYVQPTIVVAAVQELVADLRRPAKQAWSYRSR